MKKFFVPKSTSLAFYTNRRIDAFAEDVEPCKHAMDIEDRPVIIHDAPGGSIPNKVFTLPFSIVINSVPQCLDCIRESCAIEQKQAEDHA